MGMGMRWRPSIPAWIYGIISEGAQNLVTNTDNERGPYAIPWPKGDPGLVRPLRNTLGNSVPEKQLKLMRTYTVDCAQLKDESAFWQAYLTATEPEGADCFGCNLDAFWDALNGGPGWPGECQLNFVNTTNLKTLKEGYFYQALKEIARDSEFVEVHLE